MNVMIFCKALFSKQYSAFYLKLSKNDTKATQFFSPAALINYYIPVPKIKCKCATGENFHKWYT